MEKLKVILSLLALVAVLGWLAFRFNQNSPRQQALPLGYTLDQYTIAEVLPVSCQVEAQCETPPRYLLRSNCPYTSLCLKHQCTVVCPNFKQ